MQDCNTLPHAGTSANSFLVLVINTGSTSTKIAVYRDDEPIVEQTLSHPTDELSRFGNIIEQLDWRRELILGKLAAENIAIDSLSAVIGRGGLLQPVKSGVYFILATQKENETSSGAVSKILIMRSSSPSV